MNNLKQNIDPAGPVISKKTILHGAMWGAAQQYSIRGVQFVVSIVMARLLLPEQYGILAIISVFLNFSQIFIDSGLGTALIRKKDVTDIDFHTVNITNIVVSLLFYCILFVFSPLIAKFYQLPLLTPTIRVMALTFVISSLSGVGMTMMQKRLMFKKIAIISISTSMFAGVVGIIMAYLGLGVWALVLQSVLSNLFTSIIIFAFSGFRPKWIFSKESFRNLFGFSSKLLGSNLLWSLTYNMYNLLIGKFMGANSLAFFSRANSYSTLIPVNIGGVLERVMFPVLSVIQDDAKKFQNLYNKSLQVTSFYIIAFNSILIGTAFPLIKLMLTDKWIECVPLLQILCVSTMMSHINSINGKFLITKGFSGVFLSIQSIGQPITIAVFLISLYWGLLGVVTGQIILVAINTGMNFYFIQKKIPTLSITAVLKSLAPMFLASAICSLAGMLSFQYILLPTWYNIILVAVGISAIYGGFGRLCFPAVLKEALTLHKM